jgi:hypothetical protein
MWTSHPHLPHLSHPPLNLCGVADWRMAACSSAVGRTQGSYFMPKTKTDAETKQLLQIHMPLNITRNNSHMHMFRHCETESARNTIPSVASHLFQHQPNSRRHLSHCNVHTTTASIWHIHVKQNTIQGKLTAAVLTSAVTQVEQMVELTVAAALQATQGTGTQIQSQMQVASVRQRRAASN